MYLMQVYLFLHRIGRHVSAKEQIVFNVQLDFV